MVKRAAACLMIWLFLSPECRAQVNHKISIPSQILQELLPEIEHEHFEFDDEEREEPHSEKEFEVEEIDLNQDKRMELEIRLVDPYWCSPTGNCTIWVYRKAGVRYERILEVGDIQHLELEDSKTKGYRDITAAQHSSAVEAELFLYKFDG